MSRFPFPASPSGLHCSGVSCEQLSWGVETEREAHLSPLQGQVLPPHGHPHSMGVVGGTGK